MKKIIYLIFIFFSFVFSNEMNLNNKNKETKEIESQSLVEDEGKFYLFEGEIEKIKNKIKIYMTTNNLKNNKANVHGKFYNLSNKSKFSINGFIINNKIYLNFSSKDAINNNENKYSFEGEIGDNGIIYGIFIDDLIYEKNTQAILELSKYKVSNINLINISNEFKIISNDTNYKVFLQEQGAIIPNEYGGKINENIAKGAKNIAELKEMIISKLKDKKLKLKVDSNYENIFDLTIDYIDDNFIGFSNYNYLYDGGAHGINQERYNIYSLKTGEKLDSSLKSLIKDSNNPKLMKMILNKFKENNFSPPMAGDDNNYLPLAFFKINDLGVEFFWDVYSIAPYSEGIIRVQFSFEELKPFVKENSPYYILF